MAVTAFPDAIQAIIAKHGTRSKTALLELKDLMRNASTDEDRNACIEAILCVMIDGDVE